MFVSLENAKIFTTAFGAKQAPALLALSGWIGSWEDWIMPMSILSEHWRVISYDHRGSGATIAPIETIRFDQLVDDVFAVLDAYEIQSCVLASMSAGAAVALGAALKHPERISGLVIVNGFYYSPPSGGVDSFLSGLRDNYPATLSYFVDACIPEPDSDHLKRWGRQILDRAAQDAAIASYGIVGSVDLRDRLKEIQQRTLIIHGDADVLVSLEAAQQLATLLPKAKLTVLNGAGHVPIMTRPHEVAQAIMEFFGKSV